MFLAHRDQSVSSHLLGVAYLAKINADKIGMGRYGELLGLLHDFGKYSSEFQGYLANAIKISDPHFNPDEDEEFEDPRDKKGKIDHSTAGAQLLSSNFSGSSAKKILGQILSICLVSHHSGLINCITTDKNGTWNSYIKRLLKDDQKTHKEDSIQKADKLILKRVNEILQNQFLTKPFEEVCAAILNSSPERLIYSPVVQFQIGLLVRYLFSALIDADRQNSADSEKPKKATNRQNSRYRSWKILSDRLERRLSVIKQKNYIDKIRQKVSRNCCEAAERPKGLYTLTVPTGGGKTLASLRFALNHAKKHKLDRIVYIVPFTTIIDQNAQVVREILEPKDYPEDFGKVVLENHSNIGAEVQSWKEKLLNENWDAPIIFTTMVQFLEALFGAGTRGARRMHQLGKALIIFDEIQSLPIRCVHLFNNAINFIVGHCGSSVVLCTATQPLLGSVADKKGALKLSETNELMPNVGKLFEDLKRVNVHDCRKMSGWKDSEIAMLAVSQVKVHGSCLVVTNTKKTACKIFEETRKNGIEAFHLSTGMCPVHRKQVLKTMLHKLEREEPILCVSTQLIEAGVDISFRSVIRMLSGLDSIAQAAGRCNRHGNLTIGNVFIVNSAEENLDSLKDIAVGKEKSNRVLDDYKNDPQSYDNNIIGPKMLEWFYQNYFYAQINDMDYPVFENRKDTLLNMLSENSFAVADLLRTKKAIPDLRQSFMTAAKLFKSIDAPTHSVIVKFDNEGECLIGQLSSTFEVEKQYALIKKAQQYSVNLFPYEFNKLAQQNALHRVQEGTDIFYLEAQYYSKITGISLEQVKQEEQFHDVYIA